MKNNKISINIYYNGIDINNNCDKIRKSLLKSKNSN